MSSYRSGHDIIARLHQIRSQFGPHARDEKLCLLQSVESIDVQTVAATKRLHNSLCFIRAFPDSPEHHQLATAELRRFDKRVTRLSARARYALSDTGITGTTIHYQFSFQVAKWLAQPGRGLVRIGWDTVETTSELDALIDMIIQPSEADYFDSGLCTTRAWIDAAVADSGHTDFSWLLAQLSELRLARIWSQRYDAAELPLIWKLNQGASSKSLNTMPSPRIYSRSQAMRKRVPAAKKEIARRIESLRKVSPNRGQILIDVAMASLAVRHRETYHFNHANPNEVYLADVGQGVSIAVFGLREAYRFPLECTMGFLILSHGTPIGYGGASLVFRQVNTGINIFDEYRGSEAASFWVQVMRVYHQLTGCTRFIANPYQIGHQNSEAVRSGAFWFYYRLGYRPVSAPIRKLAQAERLHMRNDSTYRSSAKTLRQLATGDMHLTLPSARASEFFDERFIAISSLLATRALSAAGGSTRTANARRVATKVAKELKIQNLSHWTTERRNGFEQLAPIVLASGLPRWPNDAKRSIRKLLLEKGGPSEAQYARSLGRQTHFLTALRASCSDASKF